MRPSLALAEIKKFIVDLKLDSSGVDPDHIEARMVYRKFHAFLVWDLLLDREQFPDQLRLYARESVADCSTAYFLTLTGAYKPARLSLRSAIENTLRIIISSHLDVSKIENIPLLVSETRRLLDTDRQKSRISSLYSIYGQLCLTVHSAGIDYMSLRVPFERIFEHNSDELKNNLELLGQSLKFINEILFVSYSKYLHLIDFKNADLIRDAVDISVKNEANLTFGTDSKT